MVITDVDVRLPERCHEVLKAFASMTLDGVLVVHGMRVIARSGGKPFVAMPQHFVLSPCERCRHATSRKARYCHNCGEARPQVADEEKSRFDTVHPIVPWARAAIEAAVLGEYERVKELER